MSTLILDVPAPVAARWYTLSEDEKRRRLPALIETIEAVSEVSESVEPGGILPDDDTDRLEARAAIGEALAEVEAGKDMSYETFQQNRAAFWEARKSKHHSPSPATEVKVSA